MPNIKNLTPFQSANEAREKGKLGGIASGKKRRRIKEFKELTNALLDCSAPVQEAAEIREQFPELENVFLDWRTIVIYKQILQALKGNTRAFEALRNTVGEEPAKKKPKDEYSGVSKEALEAFDAVVGLECLDKDEIEVLSD